jgi:hypothetical protein
MIASAASQRVSNRTGPQWSLLGRLATDGTLALSLIQRKPKVCSLAYLFFELVISVDRNRLMIGLYMESACSMVTGCKSILTMNLIGWIGI